MGTITLRMGVKFPLNGHADGRDFCFGTVYRQIIEILILLYHTKYHCVKSFFNYFVHLSDLAVLFVRLMEFPKADGSSGPV